MKELKLETRVEVYAVGELDNIYRQLYEAAFEASKKSYAPYKYEIQMLREQVFNPHMKEQILADAEN